MITWGKKEKEDPSKKGKKGEDSLERGKAKRTKRVKARTLVQQRVKRTRGGKESTGFQWRGPVLRGCITNGILKRSRIVKGGDQVAGVKTDLPSFSKMPGLPLTGGEGKKKFDGNDGGGVSGTCIFGYSKIRSILGEGCNSTLGLVLKGRTEKKKTITA